MEAEYDVAVIGAGIAGTSLAASLPPGLKVVVLEQEAQPGYHSTGRSAALFSETYGAEPLRALTRASRAFYESPPDGLVDAPLLTPRGALFIATQAQMPDLEAFAAAPGVAGAAEFTDAAETRRLSPLLADGYAAGGLFERDCADIDVHGLQTAYTRLLRRNGGAMMTSARVTGLVQTAGRWRIATDLGEISARIVVNAAGAWADDVAAMAGVARKGVQPYRRTLVTVPCPDLPGLAHSPMTIDVDEQFYWKPDSGRLLLSLAEETPVPPGDAQPDEFDVAVAVDRVEQATILQVRRVENRWAGLRSFAPDRLPVIGFDAEAAGFFWLAGQGGYGIQTAPAAALYAAALLIGEHIPDSIAREGLDPGSFRPDRPALIFAN